MMEDEIMSKRKTHEEFVNEMKEVNPNIDILGEYVNSNIKEIINISKLNVQNIIFGVLFRLI